MKARDYFPLGKASGEAFCNREIETDWLIDNIEAGRHSLIIAPRRFGKSSLAEHAVSFTDYEMLALNFNTCADEANIENLIRHGVSHLMTKMLGSIDKITNFMQKFVTHLKPKITIGPKFARLELTADNNNSVANNTEETLMILERFLASKKQRATLIFDEFQTVGLIAKGRGVEAAIRNAAQNTKYLSIIFSGSNRSLLQSMFDDEGRPLYKLCRKLTLKRIEKKHYQKHLDKAARLAWKTKLKSELIDLILSLTDCHPYYVNYLCDVIWTECKISPSMLDIQRAWKMVIEEERSDVNAELATLSLNQKKILKHIANFTSNDLMSKQVTKSTGLALSSLAGAVYALIQKDIIEKEGQKYRIVNPIVKCILNEGNIGSEISAYITETVSD